MRTQGFTIVGTEFTVAGDMLLVGAPAPDFRLTANNWSTRTLSDYAGMVKVISVVPSLDTSVCAAQTRRFNEAASGLDARLVVLTISADLPYAQARWCAAEGIDRVETLSDHRDMNFSTAYGVNVVDVRICQRAALVVDARDRVVWAQYVPDIDDEVDFDAALNAARVALQDKGE